MLCWGGGGGAGQPGIKLILGQAKLIISFSSYVQEFPQAGGWLFILFFVMNIIKCHHEFH